MPEYVEAQRALRESAVGCYAVMPENDVDTATAGLLLARLARFALDSELDTLYAPTRRVRVLSGSALTVLDTAFTGWVGR